MSVARARVLVTGATGFIGGHVARRLLAEKRAAVRGLARDPSKAQALAKLGVAVVKGDLTDLGSLERAVEGCSVVIHAAAQVSSVPNRETFEQSNVTGTQNLLRAAAMAGVSLFVHLSSIAVFGLSPSGEITDDSARHHCGDPYCDTKLDAEEAVFHAYHEAGLPVVILRPSAVYGPGSAHWSVVPLKRIKKGKMLLFGGGKGLLNYVYVDNLVDAVLLVAEDERAVGQAFIVNDGAVTWGAFFGALARMAGKQSLPSLPLWTARLWANYRNFVAALRGEKFRVHPNSLGFLTATAVYRQSRIEERLGHRTRVGLEEGLRRTEDWFRENGFLT